MKRHFLRVIFTGICIGLCCGTSCTPLQETSHDRLAGVPELASNAEDLKNTVISAHLEVPIDGKNVIWCGTFQLAWNKLCELFGEEVTLEGNPPMVAELNKKTFTKDYIDKDSYNALAGVVKDGIIRKTKNALQKTFKGAASPLLIPNRGDCSGDHDIITYAYFFKHLSFKQPFEKLDDPIFFEDPVDFAGIAVKAFGTLKYAPYRQNKSYKTLIKQVSIYDYLNGDDFIVELKTKSPDNYLILAKIKPAKTLRKTITAVLRRMNKAKVEPMLYGDIIQVPMINFDITRRYNEIERPLSEKSELKAQEVARSVMPYEILWALQHIRLRLDETGVLLKSEADMDLGFGGPSPHRIMIFDKPFLLMMQRKGVPQPYFALWINDSELLVKDKTSDLPIR